ncbi:MAG: hypothetical protein KatS3mg051_1094 [Anaerolineae bacterium]|nr:MAG: hypothetical protein KatS3mg051_1094 [Anaerolineae bacterium]
MREEAMMRVYVPDSGLEATLSIVDPDTGVNYAQDFIGNAGALSDGQFVFSEEHGAYLCSSETLEWWVEVLEEYQALEDRIHSLERMHGWERVQRVLDEVPAADLEDYPGRANTALDKEFGQ